MAAVPVALIRRTERARHSAPNERLACQVDTPNHANPAFLLTDRRGAFGAAKQVPSFMDEERRARVETANTAIREFFTGSRNARYSGLTRSQARSSPEYSLDNFRVLDRTLTL